MTKVELEEFNRLYRERCQRLCDEQANRDYWRSCWLRAHGFVRKQSDAANIEMFGTAKQQKHPSEWIPTK